MSKKDRYIVALDIGSTKTCALIGEQEEDGGGVRFAALGAAESKGWRKGVIVNLDLTELAVKKALEAAEAASGVSVDAAYVGVAGAHIKGVNSQGAITLGKSPTTTHEVERDDMRRVIQTAQGINLP